MKGNLSSDAWQNIIYLIKYAFEWLKYVALFILALLHVISS